MIKIRIDEIKDRVPLEEALATYGFHLKHGRMPCPLHNGKDDNFAVKRNSWRCFVCGEHGDVISFVQKYFGLSFLDALKKLNDDFNLGLNLGNKATPTPITTERTDVQKKAEERKARLDALQTRYNEAFEAFAACDVIITRLRPVSAVGVSGVSEAYAWAVKNIDRCWHELKEAEIALFEFDSTDG